MQWYTLKEAAEYLGYTPHRMYQFTSRGGGPEYYKLDTGGIRYRREDLDAWVMGKGETNEISKGLSTTN